MAALCGLASALVIAVGVFRMPAVLAAAAAGYGVAYGLFPIGWIVLNAIFIYDITVKTGKFEVVKHGIAALASDRRIQALLIAFSFGAFIEGAAGFGTPVAISAALLVGLGFKPLQAAGLSLLGNTAPVAYGALGTPLIALARVTELDLGQLSAMVGRQLPFFSLLVPFWLVVVMAGWRGMLEVWPACLVAGGSFAVSQFLVSNYHGPWLVDVMSSVVSMLALVVLLRFWQPRTVWRFEHERGDEIDRYQPIAARLARRLDALGLVVRVRVCLGAAAGQAASSIAWARSSCRFPGSITPSSACRRWCRRPKREEAVFSLNVLSATGTALLLAGRCRPGLLLKLSPCGAAATVLADAVAREHVAADDRRHAGARLHHAVQRPGYDDGPGVCPHGRVVPVFLAPARLAGGGADGQRHGLQRAVRQPAAGRRRADRRLRRC